ncbi:hypothetical protein SRHO_G00034010 [Serrasalmus rhombeus]
MHGCTRVRGHTREECAWVHRRPHPAKHTMPHDRHRHTGHPPRRGWRGPGQQPQDARNAPGPAPAPASNTPPRKEGLTIHNSTGKEDTEYMFFYQDKSGRQMCIDAQLERCTCHPHLVTYGRMINHSRNKSNLQPILHSLDGTLM